MVKGTPLNVALTPEQHRFVEDRLATGRYADAGAVVDAGLALLAEREASTAELRARLERSAAQAEAGELLTPGQVNAMVEQRRAELRRGR